MSYHNPVLLDECIEGLNINPSGIYADLTFGGGGHSKVILDQLKDGHLYGFDQDTDAHNNTLEHPNFTLIKGNFRYLKKLLRLQGVRKIDGILADLGISSHQIDEATRGFSLRFEGPLDMRMNQALSFNAADLVNTYTQEEITRVLKDFGEFGNAWHIAGKIVVSRECKKIETTEDLKQCIISFAPRNKHGQFWARIFQAFRIEVNEEIKALEEMLLQTSEVLKPEGRLVVISYHSLEDRPVKNFLRSGKINGEQEKDFFGKLIRPFEPVNRKPILPTEEEIQVNPRARSAKLRVATRNHDET